MKDSAADSSESVLPLYLLILGSVALSNVEGMDVDVGFGTQSPEPTWLES